MSFQPSSIAGIAFPLEASDWAMDKLFSDAYLPKLNTSMPRFSRGNGTMSVGGPLLWKVLGVLCASDSGRLSLLPDMGPFQPGVLQLGSALLSFSDSYFAYKWHLFYFLGGYLSSLSCTIILPSLLELASLFSRLVLPGP